MKDYRNSPYGLTPEQIKAAKKVYRAIKAAYKLGVCFWDNYGTLSCFNGHKIRALHMEETSDTVKQLEWDDYYYENLPCFGAGNSDDPIYIEPK